MIPGILSYYLHSILTFPGAVEEATYRSKKVFQVGRRVRAAPMRGSLGDHKILTVPPSMKSEKSINVPSSAGKRNSGL